MKQFVSIVILTCLSVASYAQLADKYRSKDNPLYWKNRKPDAAYWQQDVNYKINARIDEEKNTIVAKESLQYWNNSPDTLHYVYFHMWQNAFIKGSYLHDLERANKVEPDLGDYEKAGLGIVVEHLKVNGQDVKTELDNTILKVYLPKPLLPGGKVTFSMNFTTYWDKGATRRRMKMYDAWGYKHYNGVQWFPKMCVYDRKFGWDTYQHLNKEFYGDFGTYDVTLDFASNYIVEATGELKNRKEVLPDTLRKRLDVKNFKDKKWDEAPSVIIPYVKGERKEWHFQAMNVHDFAFTGDPTYRIATEYWNGIECVGLCQEPHARGWQNSAKYVAKIVKAYSEDFGMFQYPKMVAADAADGMEYPMLTLDGGSNPGYKSLLVHEIGHNWFYGMVGNNETYRASLDEGFTQFLTAWAMGKLEGDTVSKKPEKKLVKKMLYNVETHKDRRVFNRYLYDALNQSETPLNTHSNDFHDALHHENGYGMVYYKTATMLYNLQYTLGDSLFHSAIKHYFHQWRFAHPYFNDFRNSIIHYTHVDLNWFFDEWLETTKVIDYSLRRIKKIPGEDSFAIRIRRKGTMQMPIDLTVTAKDGKKYSYYIPNTWFEKETDATTLDRWYGWGGMNSTYDAHVQIPGGIKNVQIDTSTRLADVYILDNYKSRMLPFSPKALKIKPDLGVANVFDRRHNRAYIRPDLWWNPVDGIKAGVHLEGNYLNTMHFISATVWVNTHMLQDFDYRSFQDQGWYAKYVPLNYNISYNSPLTRFTPRFKIHLQSKFLDGLWYHKGGFSWEKDENNVTGIYAQTMWRGVSYDLDYLVYRNEWSSRRGRPNSSLNAYWSHSYKYFNGWGNYVFSVRAPFFTGGSADDFNYAYAQVEAVNTNRLGKLDVRTRLFARYGTGSNIPYESALWLAGANPEELMNNKYTRSIGFVPNDWRNITSTEINHFQMGGGLNLRGYAGYFVGDMRNGQILIGYKGRSGVSGNIEVDFDKYIPLHPSFTSKWLHVDVYAFADGGLIELSSVANLNNYWNLTPTTMWSDIRVDAGIGFAATIKRWGKFDKARPLTIRADMPLFINRPPYVNDDYFAPRYVVGVSRTF